MLLSTMWLSPIKNLKYRCYYIYDVLEDSIFQIGDAMRRSNGELSLIFEAVEPWY